MSTYDIAVKLVALGLENGGGTVDPNTGEIVEANEGYTVGGLVPTHTIEADDTALLEATRGFIEANTGGLVGIWLHEGVVYLDAVELVDDLFAAVDRAHMRGELAIWDCANGCEIDTRRTA